MHTQSLSQKVLHLETNETQSSMEHSEVKDSAVEPNIGITYQGGASYILWYQLALSHMSTALATQSISTLEEITNLSTRKVGT
jgi:hypothetical protein